MALNFVTLLVEVADAGQDAGTGAVQVTPTSVVTAAGQTVVSQQTVTRQLSGGSVSVQLVATDNAGTSPAAGFWAYSILLPGAAVPQLYLVNYADGASQRLDDLTPVVAKTTYGPAASSAAFGGGTLTEYIAPAVVPLTDAATIAVDASAGNDFRVTLGGSRTIGAPSNPADGQDIVFVLTQDGMGSRTVTWNAVYDFGTDGAPVLTATAGKTDIVGFKYRATSSAWLCTGWKLGF